MGIQDRDYMKRGRPDDDDNDYDSSTESKAEDVAQRLLNKFPRLFLYFGIGFVILILITFVIFEFTSH